MKLPATLLLTYQAEYEQSPTMSIEDLCNKYSLDIKQLVNHDKWTKRVKIAPPYTQTIVTPERQQLANTKEPEDIKSKIANFKELAIEHALSFMKNDAKYAEVKEFKDMVSIVDAIEKSYNDKVDTSTTINIAIQNLVEKFNDDC